MKSASKSTSDRPRLKDPLAVIPLKPDAVDLKRDSGGMIHLRRRGDLRGLRKKMADFLGHDYSQKLELDEYGTLYYTLADGSHTLHHIVDAMLPRVKKDRKEVEGMVVLFTKKLMTMNLIHLKVPGETIAGGAHERA